MKAESRNLRKPIARATLVIVALSMVAGCISQMDPAEVAALKSKNNDLENAVKLLTTQVRTLNEEHVEMKRIVSDMTDSVLKQTGTLERLDASMKELSERPAPRAAAAAAPVPAARRLPSRSTAVKAPSKPAPRSAPARTSSRPAAKKPAPRRE